MGEGWKKAELKIHGDGITALCNAVVKQWIIDGKPAYDRDNISIWLETIKELSNEKNNI
jgi:hypothetical protein